MSALESTRTGSSNCGIYLPTARPIDPIIRSFLSSNLRACTMRPAICACGSPGRVQA